MKLTLAQVKSSDLPAKLNLPECDARFLSIVNQGQQRLIMRAATWFDFHWKYRISVTSGILTTPPEIASISAMSRCCHPIDIHDMWFEFLDSGYGLRDSDGTGCSCLSEALDRGMTPVATDMTGAYKLKVYCDLATDNGEVVLIKGYDSNGNWVRTLDTGVYIDGEKVLANTAGTLSTTTWGFALGQSIVSVQKAQTDGPVRLYEFVNPGQTLLSVYQWWETVPRYRRFWIGGICDTTDTHTINAIAKREFIPVQNDSDVLMIGNLPALKAICFAIEKEDKNDQAAAMVDEARAIRIMNDEAQHYLGVGMKVPIKMDAGTWGAGELGNGMAWGWGY